MLYRFIALLVLVILLSVTTSAQGDPAPNTIRHTVAPFDPARDAEKDIQQAVLEAGRTGKRILLDVGGEWCIWCRRMDTLFVTHDDLWKAREASYITVKVNYSKENKNEALLSKYPKIPGYPHIFVLEKDGSLLHSQDTSLLEKGKGYDTELVMAFLKKWAPK